jgi:hypothetical protein
MTDEPIKRYCVCCGRKLPSNMNTYELVRYGAGTSMGDGSIIFHCIARHTQEQIAAAAARPPAFHRASEEPR